MHDIAIMYVYMYIYITSKKSHLTNAELLHPAQHTHNKIKDNCRLYSTEIFLTLEEVNQCFLQYQYGQHPYCPLRSLHFH